MNACGCYVETEDGYGDDGLSIRSTIVYCPLHKYAKQMRDALREAVVEFEPVAQGPWSAAWLRDARALLREVAP